MLFSFRKNFTVQISSKCTNAPLDSWCSIRVPRCKKAAYNATEIRHAILRFIGQSIIIMNYKKGLNEWNSLDN